MMIFGIEIGLAGLAAMLGLCIVGLVAIASATEARKNEERREEIRLMIEETKEHE